MEITAEQIKAARAALGLTVKSISDATDIGLATLKRYEASTGVPKSRKGHLEKLRQFFEAAGIEFIGTADEGPGIRLWKEGRPAAGDAAPGPA
jgi:transcriptional regulator with XRE-family HTH domain